MASEKEIQQATTIFHLICKSFDELKLSYEKFPDDLHIEIEMNGDDLPMKHLILIKPEVKLVTFISPLPLVAPDDKRLEVAIAVSVVNNMLIDGSFDYDISTGRMLFRLTNSYCESLMSGEVFQYLLACSCKTIDEYNDKFLMLAKSMMTLEQFIEFVSKKEE